MKRIERIGASALCLLLALALALPGFAALQSGVNVLRLRYLPGGDRIPGVVFTAYRVAEPAASGAYLLADGYEDPEGRLQELVDALNGRELVASVDPGANSPNAEVPGFGSAYGEASTAPLPVFDYGVSRDWINAFGGYINNFSRAADGGYNAAENADVLDQPSASTDENGRVVLSGLPDGIYLVASNGIYRNASGIEFVAAPFVIQLPYTEGETRNTDVSANVKWFTPAAQGGGSQYRPSTVDRDPDPDPDPDGDPEIDIGDDPVPLTELPDIGEDEELMEIEDEETPLAMLPQTGLLWWPVPVMAAAGLLLILVGLTVKRRP